MVTQRQLNDYRALNKAVEAAVISELRTLWDGIKHLETSQIKAILVNAVPDVIDKYGSMSAAVAAEWFEELIGTGARIPDLSRPEAYVASTRWAISPLYSPSPNLTVAFAHLIQASTRHVKDHGRGVIDDSVSRTPGVYYARVPTGATTCAFCLVMASRGPVYSSRESARYRASDGAKFHAECDCEQVPMRGVWTENPSDPRGWTWDGDQVAGYRFNDLYAENYKPYHEEQDSIRDVVGKMRAANPGMH